MKFNHNNSLSLLENQILCQFRQFSFFFKIRFDFPLDSCLFYVISICEILQIQIVDATLLNSQKMFLVMV